ncbi:MAG TPA: YqaJ viral recombinase family protein, partial [Pseudomonas sp.]|nr:YqaJ viral recombinase family protein [Pseudomonas sp.]
MQRKTLNLVQGTDAWHQHRASHFNASDAPAMMGSSKYRTRSELLREKATGLAADVSEQQQRLYDRGHEAEALIRPLIEQQIGEELYSTTMSAVVDGLPLSASLDGQNLVGDTLLECKLWNEGLAEQVRAGELEPHYFWQLEHQLLVSGAERVIFATGDGERLETMEYRAVPGRAEQLIAGWHQFAKDLADYQPEPLQAEVVAAPVAGFGALSLRVEGRVLASNLDTFKADAEAFIARLPKPSDLQTDQDFADGEAA